MFGGPQFAKRTALGGSLTRGGLGKPLGRGEVALNSQGAFTYLPNQIFSTKHLAAHPP